MSKDDGILCAECDSLVACWSQRECQRRINDVANDAISRDVLTRNDGRPEGDEDGRGRILKQGR